MSTNYIYLIKPREFICSGKNIYKIGKTKQNNFKNWKCAVGIDTMRIVGNNIYRGVCGMGDVQYSLDDDFKFSDDFIVCNTDRCFCTTDLITTKIK